MDEKDFASTSKGVLVDENFVDLNFWPRCAHCGQWAWQSSYTLTRHNTSVEGRGNDLQHLLVCKKFGTWIWFITNVKEIHSRLVQNQPLVGGQHTEVPGVFKAYVNPRTHKRKSLSITERATLSSCDGLNFAIDAASGYSKAKASSHSQTSPRDAPPTSFRDLYLGGVPEVKETATSTSQAAHAPSSDDTPVFDLDDGDQDLPSEDPDFYRVSAEQRALYRDFFGEDLTS